MGPTLSFRGIDNASYYILGDDPRYYFDTTGLRQHDQSAQPACPSDGHGFASLLGPGMPCRRFSVRPGLFARPRPRHLRPQRRLPRRGAPGSRTLARKNSSPSPGTLAPTATSSATFRPAGRNGTTATATRCAASGKATKAARRSSAGKLLAMPHAFDKRGRRPWASVNFRHRP